MNDKIFMLKSFVLYNHENSFIYFEYDTCCNFSRGHLSFVLLLAAIHECLAYVGGYEKSYWKTRPFSFMNGFK